MLIMFISLSSSKVKNVWNYNSAPTYIFMVWHLVKHWENFDYVYFITHGYKCLPVCDFLFHLKKG